jgi:hypothetical protein
MEKHVRRLVLIGLFAVSVGVAGAVFAKVVRAGPLLPCPHCDAELGCTGSTCVCPRFGGTCIVSM